MVDGDGDSVFSTAMMDTVDGDGDGFVFVSSMEIVCSAFIGLRNKSSMMRFYFWDALSDTAWVPSRKPFFNLRGKVFK